MEAAAKEYEQVIGAGIEKVVRRLIKRYSGSKPFHHKDTDDEIYQKITKRWGVHIMLFR